MNAGPWLVAAVAFAASAGLTPVILRIATALSLVAPPNLIVPQHREGVPVLGGLAIAGAICAALVLLDSSASLALLPGAAAFVAIGAIDDLRSLAPGPKLALQSAAATVAALTSPAVEGPLPTILAAGAFLVAVNAANLTDVCDGLVSGLACIASVAFVWIAPDRALEAAACAGACAGFLVWNRPPAHIFLGDLGSELLGFWLACLALASIDTIGAPRGLPAAACVVAVFLFELAFLIVVRTRKGRPFWLGSPDHFSLRLQRFGHSRAATLGIAWASGGVAALAGIAVAVAPPAIAIGAVCAIFASALFAAQQLTRHEA